MSAPCYCQQVFLVVNFFPANIIVSNTFTIRYVTARATCYVETALLLPQSADMKVSEQCGIAVSKGNQILGLIRRNITYKEKS